MEEDNGILSRKKGQERLLTGGIALPSMTYSSIGIRFSLIKAYESHKIITFFAPVAQLDRASASGAEGCEFDPRQAHHSSQPGRNKGSAQVPKGLPRTAFATLARGGRARRARSAE